MKGIRKMNRIMLRSGVAAIALLLMAGMAQAETAAEAVRRLHEKSKSVATAHYTQIITNSSQMAESKTTSEVWQMRDENGVTKMRSEMKSEMTMKGMDMPPQKTEAITVMDGELLWSEMQNMGTTMVTKMKTPPEAQMGLEFLVEHVEKGNGRVLEPEAIDGKQCVVIEYTMDDMMGGAGILQRAWIAEENGMMLKSVTKGGDMMGDTEMTIKDVKVGIEIDPAKFTYTPPEGAQVMDMTSM
jgi:outer membrane lipoprotein-sorting protein